MNESREAALTAINYSINTPDDSFNNELDKKKLAEIASS